MPFPAELLIHRLAIADAATARQIVDSCRDSDDPAVLVAAALFAADPTELLQRARALATTSLDRQQAAIATAYLAGDRDRVQMLARDHLADHPQSVVVAWIAASSQHLEPNRKDQS